MKRTISKDKISKSENIELARYRCDKISKVQKIELQNIESQNTYRICVVSEKQNIEIQKKIQEAKYR